MFNRLLARFPNARLVTPQTPTPEHMTAFFDEVTKETLWIPKKDLSSEVFDLLETLFPNQEPTFTSTAWNARSEEWRQALLENGAVPLEEQKVRFHFFYCEDQEALVPLQEGLSSLSDSVIGWSGSPSLLVVIEREGMWLPEDILSLQEAIESDFYIKVRSFHGLWWSVNNKLRHHFQREFKWASTFFPSRSAPQSIPELFPLFLWKELHDEQRQEWKLQLAPLLEDPTLLHTMFVYVKHNANASATAKELYMHRNSLLYRIEKFQEITGLGLQSIESSMLIYFAYMYILHEEDHSL
ncbi:PucR family transcriptional regulator [Bacillus fonticola]|uniref:PucR family transcriptional regulator n=1 Tax=Bacillus fonticola TaxID=2728853 RepID=UPI001474E956|nr:helix-turn-helix domain-containing protein [Bacillus fonticola]